MFAKIEQNLKGVQEQPPRVFYKKAIFKKHLQENTCVGVTLLKKRTTILKNIGERLFLGVTNSIGWFSNS